MNWPGVDADKLEEKVPRVTEAPAESKLAKPDVSCTKEEWKECSKEEREAWKTWEKESKKEAERQHYRRLKSLESCKNTRK